MSAWKHPATIVASLALFVALGGGTALAGGLNDLISGKKIVSHSIGKEKLTAGAIKALRGHAYSATSLNHDPPSTQLPDHQGWATVESLTLAPGSYVVVGRVTLNTPSGRGDACRLWNQGDIDFTATGAPWATPGSIEWSTLSLVGPLKTSTSTTVTLECQSLTGGGIAYLSHLVAIKVGSVTGR